MEQTQTHADGIPSRRAVNIKVFTAAVLLLATTAPSAWSSTLMAATSPVEQFDMEKFLAGNAPMVIAFMFSILILKITAFVLGYLIVRLGHDTLIKGIAGQIDFGFKGSGFKTKLKSASPGGLFVLMGAAIIIWGLTVQKPMEIKGFYSPPKSGADAPATTDGSRPRPVVPD